MSDNSAPHIGNCGFCEDGLVRLRRCSLCDAPAAVCDECELAWIDVAAFSEDNKTESNGSFPTCPSCSETTEDWPLLSNEELIEAGFEDLVEGESP